MKLKIARKAKDPIIWTKWKSTEWDKIFINFTCNRVLIPKTYKKLKKLYIHNTTNLDKKQGTYLNRLFSKGKTLIKNHSKNCSVSLASGEC